jgi:formamidopyrimidine-DNA glycosylase
MPEGPEVKTTVDFLKSYEGKKLIDLTVLSGRYTRKPIDNINNPNWKLPLILEEVNCKGKFIHFSFNGNVYFFNTLGMTGMWSNSISNYTRIKLDFQGESVPLFYNDMRNFGTFKISLSEKDLDRKLNSIGPDFLKDGWGPGQFYNLLKKKPNKTITEFLMNQKNVSGIGNYLKAECLYDAKISPHRFCAHITTDESDRLFYSCRRIIQLSYKTGGATIQNYRKPNGKKGLYSQRFAVYNQKTAPCGNKVIKEKTLDKRTTHWVPAIQK